LGFQLPCITGDEANNTGFDKIVRHKENYRCKDPILLEILNELREMIALKTPKSQINKWVMDKFRELGRIITKEEIVEKYTIEDMIISGTNELKDYYTDLFKGKFQVEKYYVLENNRQYCNGNIVIGEKPEGCKSEVRHCFTTHSTQGKSARFKLLIDSSKMFDSRMFYTALSRATTMNQIFIIENQDHIFKYPYGKIYKISSGDKIYIGSTILPLEKRFQTHKANYKKYKKDGGKFITSFPLLDDGKIELIENYRCNDLKVLWKREAEIIKRFGNKCVNSFNETED
jgi:hypothetical protein